MPHSKIALSLFWRTFLYLAVLLAGGVFAWTQTFRALEFEPRAVQSAQQVASLVNLAATVLSSVDGINRVALLKTLQGPGIARIRHREPSDVWKPFEVDRFTHKIAQELRFRLGADTVVASQLNGVDGMWVGVVIEQDALWVQADTARILPIAASTWFTWVGIALLSTVAGSAAVARLINQPLRDLSSATSRISDGEFNSRLDENTLTSEIRQVNRGFNMMARELAKVEEDRAVMMAGISHDLRTPLARLRLEIEMSVADDEARRNMASDIQQLDTTIDKFMDYARPGEAQLKSVPLAEVVRREASSFRDASEIVIDSSVSPHTLVLADEVELGRVLQNLFENARRYARSDTAPARVVVSDTSQNDSVVLCVRDFGPGVTPSKLDKITTPFFRGDEARTAAAGAGLGLAIVDKTAQRMGGRIEVRNARGGGLQIDVSLKRAA